MRGRLDAQLTPEVARPTLTEGEAWAREQLEALRAERFTLPATQRFLAASRARSRTTRAARPALARRAHAWLAFGAAAWMLPAAAGLQPFRRRLGPGLVWWGSVALMLDWHLGMLEGFDGDPRQLGPPDALTLARAWLVPLAADSPTVFICGLGAATDLLDGPLARRSVPTRAGRDLEGLVDACFTLTALRGLVRTRRLGRGAALAEAGRIAVGVGYATFVYFSQSRPPELRVLRASRATTCLRFAGVLAAAAGRPRFAAAVLVSGSLGSIGLTALAARRT